MDMNGKSVFFLAIPAVMTIILNIFVLMSVLIVLRKQLLFGNNFNRKTHDVNRKTARAVIILIPILGLHFLVLPMRPQTGSSLAFVYEVHF